MFRYNALKSVLISQLFFGFFIAIVTNERIFESTSFEGWQDFFGTEYSSVPGFEVVQLLDWQPSKETASPVLKIAFNYFGAKTIVVLNIVEDHDLIGPSTTGLWSAKYNPNAYQNVSYTPRPDIFESIGNYHLYQNSSRGAALAIFYDDDNGATVVGVVEHSYIVMSVPSRVSSKLRKRSLEPATRMGSTNFTGNHNENSSPLLAVYRKPNMTQTRLPLRNSKPLTSRHADGINRRPRRSLPTVLTPDVVYPKLLISVDYHSVSNKHLCVMDLIAYLNVVDMMYRQIDDPRIRLTIGAIILPEDELARPYVAQNSTSASMMGAEIIRNASIYFSNERLRFPRDEYDVVIVLVKDTMWGIGESGTKLEPGGVSFGGGACNRKYNAAAVRYHNNYLGVVALVHELGHLFNLDHDTWDLSSYLLKDHCIMSPAQDSIQKLCWSSDNRYSLRSFFRSNCSRSMLKRPRKIPDSVKSMQGSWLHTGGQCQNKFNNSWGYCYDKDSCQSYRCSDNGVCSSTATSPMQGSLFPGEKRCINGTFVTTERELE